MPLARMTELDAVNLMLAVIGEAPVVTLNDTSVATVDLSERLLQETSFEIQSQGYSFNSEYNYPLTADQDGFMNIPLNCVRCDIDASCYCGGGGAMDVVVRGGRLYDRFEKAFVFTQSPIYVNMIILLEYEDLPEAARRYIAIRAARKLQDRVLGSQTIHAYSEQDELEAKMLFLSAEADDADHNILTSDHNTFRIHNRHS